MAWYTPTEDDVLSEFTPAEVATINNLLGGGSIVTTKLGAILRRTIAEIRGYIRSGAYEVDQASSTTIPVSMITDAIAITRWRFLIAAPQLKQLQTEERKDSMLSSLQKLLAVAAQDYTPDSPIPETLFKSGSWNSEIKIIMRTHPVPPPSTQFQTQPGIPPYANPNAPPDAP